MKDILAVNAVNVQHSVSHFMHQTQLILDQLAGPEKDKVGNYKFTGWPQLGGRTIVDNAVEQNKRIADLEKTVAALKGGK